ncbi:TcpE family conjugal transfer membrane protein [Cohnella zeiphila]|uniref:Conjugal transfer protein n=1 Tax=Cohnella zeiphila TaxID=2761120 RepID=A0A7X0SMV8_9BACL|nr:TcpE family conjugal transfer membrane protein [Cohnella zeiphila]MBB6732776.1 conjugal transfer protein [Cohnella zeiphila]
MDEPEKVESYRALYRVRPLIYHIGDIRLWMPIRQDGIIMWLVYVFIFFVFCYIIPVLAWVLPFDRTITIVIGPIVAAYYTVKLDPAGKTVPRYLRDILHFLVRPKWYVRWQAIRQTGARRKIHFSGSCRPYVRLTAPNGEEQWFGGKGLIGGKVKGLRSLGLPDKVRVQWHGTSGRLLIVPVARRSKRAILPGAQWESRSGRTQIWTLPKPVQMDRQERGQKQEIWKVMDRLDSVSGFTGRR